jgi:hypothetical protein
LKFVARGARPSRFSQDFKAASEQGYIYEVFPDGRRVRVKQIEPPTPVQAGRKITIR